VPVLLTHWHGGHGLYHRGMVLTVVAGALALVLVAGCGYVIGAGDVGSLLARLSPVAKLSLFGAVLILVMATGWTVGSIIRPFDTPPTSVVPTPGEH
jgi:hypothetical protein